jgi:hypothetical protein
MPGLLRLKPRSRTVFSEMLLLVPISSRKTPHPEAARPSGKKTWISENLLIINRPKSQTGNSEE